MNFFLIVFVIFAQLSFSRAEVLVSAGAGLELPSFAHTSLRNKQYLQASYTFKNDIGLGGFFSSTAKIEDFGRFNYVVSGAEVFYHFSKYKRGRMAGLRFGLAQVDWQPENDQIFDFTPYSWGCFYRENWFALDWLAYGLDFSYFSVSDDSLKRASGAVLELESFDSFSFALNLSLWF